MHKLRSLTVGLGALALVAAANAQFDGPAPLAWRWVQPTSVPPGGSPLVKGDTIYQAVGGRVYCIDRTTGNKRWQYPQLDPIAGVIRTTPILSGDTLIATGDNKIVYAIDAASGQPKWSANIPTAALGSPALVGRFLVVAMSDNSLTAIDTNDGSIAWTSPYRIDDGISGSISGSGDDVYVLTNRNELLAVNVTAQRLHWRQRFSQLPPNPSTQVANDTIFLNSGPFLIALNTLNGNARWQVPTNQQLAFAPVVGPNSVLVVTQDGKTLAYDAVTHQAITKKPIEIGSSPIVRPTPVGDMFVVLTANGAVNLIDPKSGDNKWSYIIRPLQDATANSNSNTGGPGNTGFGPGSSSNQQNSDKVTFIQAAAPAVVAGQTLLIPARDGSLLAFDKAIGVDLTPPKVEMLFPNSGDQVSGQPPLLFYFRLTDEASGLKTDSLKVEVNGTPLDYTLNKDGTIIVRFTMTGKNKPLSDGRKEIVVTASDWMGNEVKKSFALTIDNALNPIKLPGSDNNNPNGGPGGFGPGGGKGGFGGG